MPLSILLRADSTRFDAAIAELQSLLGPSEFELDGDRYPKAVELFVDGSLCVDKLLRVHGDTPAVRAGEALVSFEPSDGLLELLAALRAAHVDAHGVDADGHGSVLS
jgi:hypothetical protein